MNFFFIISILLTASGCSLSAELKKLGINSTSSETTAVRILDLSKSSIVISDQQIPESGQTQIQFCPVDQNGDFIEIEIEKVNMQFQGGSSQTELITLPTQYVGKCLDYTVKGLAAGTPVIPKLLYNTTSSRVFDDVNLKVNSSSLGFKGYADSNSPVANRVFTTVSTPTLFEGYCDPELGNVKIYSEGNATPYIVTCGPSREFSIPFSSLPARTNSYWSGTSNPTIHIKQGDFVQSTRIYVFTLAETVIYISTPAQLQAMAMDQQLYRYILTQDIDLSTVSATNNFTMIADGASTSRRFRSDLLGDSRKIKNLHMTTSQTYGSFLGYVSTSYIRDIHFENATLIASNSSHGIIAGMLRTAELHRVSVKGTLNATNASSNYHGMIVGETWNGNIFEAWSDGTMNVSGSNFGGIAGRHNGTNQSILNSWSKVNITTNATADYVGGIVGFISAGHVKNSYFSGNLGDNEKSSGIFGYFLDAGNVDHVYSTGNVAMSSIARIGTRIGYYDIGFEGTLGTNVFHLDSSLCTNCDSSFASDSVAKTQSELNNYTQLNWDYNLIWKKDINGGNPQLRSNPHY